MPNERKPLEDVAREDLCRSAKIQLRDTDDNDGFTIDGYAAVYDTPTRIDSWEGVFDEEIAFGSFGRSIRARMPKMQYDHGQHPMLGSLPLGRWTSMTEEKGAGLHAVGRMSDNWLVEPFRQAIAEGSVDGMSFRFSVVREDWFYPDGKRVRDEDILKLLERPTADGPLRRVLRELKISEAGPVAWPAYQETSVGVRSVTIDLGRLADPEQRKTLAQAVFLADAATRTDGPLITEESPDVHSPELRSEDPPVTDDSPEEHPSAAARRRRDRMRALARDYKGYIIDIERKVDA